MNLGHIHIEDTTSARSLFQRMGFRKRRGTTAKVPIPDEVKKEIELREPISAEIRLAITLGGGGSPI